MRVPSFSVVTGSQVAEVLDGQEHRVVDVVEAAYRLHGEGRTVNPPSYFLRFPDQPSNRIIALPASLGGDHAVHGLKWISSFPHNVEHDVPRASAVLLLNDARSGYPFACVESSIISATRTAASAALAATVLTRGRPRPRRVGFVGTGLIARYVHRYLLATGWSFEEIGLHDIRAAHLAGFRDHLREVDDTPVVAHPSAPDLMRSCDLVVFATVAPEPHVSDPTCLTHNPVVLHVSLRDLSPALVLAATNIVDDVDHCLRARTSVHLAELATGDRSFVHGTLHDVLEGRVTPPTDTPLVFSPFGLGVLDLALGVHVYQELAARGALVEVPGFFHELNRYGPAQRSPTSTDHRE
ncbi:2,3-diaminopropionate biosynthesis protein SbnB [Umezawaea sp. NPDC059074]|uniref:2,3-diaminopropionate biosynthesis protein SbnB n=1 Tax=Umezawaea sp. NPDC059074 TaxID=3346716 RepID=UPI0036CE9BCF